MDGHADCEKRSDQAAIGSQEREAEPVWLVTDEKNSTGRPSRLCLHYGSHPPSEARLNRGAYFRMTGRKLFGTAVAEDPITTAKGGGVGNAGTVGAAPVVAGANPLPSMSKTDDAA